MRRLYLEPAEFALDEVALDAARSRRLRQVLRLRAGAELQVFDGLGHERSAKLDRVESGAATLRLGVPVTSLEEPRVPVTLCCAFPRGERGDWLVEKATELGVAAFVALDAERAVLKPGEGRFDRWSRVAIEAAEQCGRAVVPSFLEAPMSEALELVADPGAGAPIEAALTAQPSRPEVVTIFIGPEGGWTDEERAEHAAAGRTFVSLGPRTLRVETAAVTAVALTVAALDAPPPSRASD
ncbi:MAG: RsmE family RNA methyltransferase [Dehalococcoidia bacterium]